MTYQIHHESEKYRTSLFTVKSVNISFPDGLDREYDLIDIQDAVTILPMDENGDIYFVRQFRIGARKELLELPAGKIEKGEDPLLSAKRELREEIGMSARFWKHLGNFYMTPGYATEYMHCYLAQGLISDPLEPDLDEFLNLSRFSWQKILEMIENNTLEDSKSLAVFMLAARFLGNK